MPIGSMLQNVHRGVKFLVPLLGAALLALPGATAGPARAQAGGPAFRILDVKPQE